MTLRRLHIDEVFLSNLNRNYERNGLYSVALSKTNDDWL
jgi:hypothetical protein